MKLGAICALLIPAVWGQPKLAVERMEFHQFEDGPALPASYEFLPGETVWFSTRIGGFHSVQEDQERNVKLSWKMSVTDPSGVLVEPPRSGKIESRLVAEDKDWRPKFLASFLIPPFAVGGSYRIPVTVKDELASVEIMRTLEFPVKAPAGIKADSLQIVNFRFLRNEQDALALKPAVYRPGTAMWARFDIVGYKLAEKNRFHVGYGLAILGPDGKQLFAQEEAAEDTKESFYPQRWVPGALSLNLDNNVVSATYILVVTARDKQTGETVEVREPFSVQ